MDRRHRRRLRVAPAPPMKSHLLALGALALLPPAVARTLGLRWNLHICIAEIEDAGLPVPDKSSCYFCTAMKPWEVDSLPPENLRRIVVIEARSAPRHLAYAEAKGWPRGEGVALTEGLWRRRVKGMRGATPKPGSITQYIRERGLLPSEEIDRLISLTPTEELRREDIADWQGWLAALCDRARLDCLPPEHRQ